MDGKRAREEYEQPGGQIDPKRPRYDSQGPSKVLHVRKLPAEVQEADLHHLAMPFGRVVNTLILQNKGQAFIQMEDVKQAMALVQYYSSVPASIRGQVCYFQYSNRSEITASRSQPETQNRVLICSVTNLAYPITIDVLQRVFKKFGNILRMVTFSKGSHLQALVEFDQVMSAVQAKRELDGQNIYAGCCTLSINYSNLETLTVKYNNERSRDFTNPGLPPGNPETMANAGGVAPAYPPMGGDMGLGYMNPAYGGYPMGGMGGASMGAMGAMGGIGMSTPSMGSQVVIASGFDEDRITPDIIFTLFGVYGDVIRVKILFNKKHTALVQFTSHLGADNVCKHLNGRMFMGKELKINYSRHQSVALPKHDLSTDGELLTKDFTGSPLHRFKYDHSKHYAHVTPPVEMMHVANLPQDYTMEKLHALFSQYGTIVASKFFENNKHMALVQMATPEEATHALVFLHNVNAEGNHLRVSFSKSRIAPDEAAYPGQVGTVQSEVVANTMAPPIPGGPPPMDSTEEDITPTPISQ
eukprot:CAMPEP_0119118746 /NCGR_PEP_ID=MMETSP1310-20130426/522_1 /TAXON_ID=464262 /ORGANISM="Genus nov. species nov., Strain RCC2339" /LENGTH=526 /DNA_ID=CAMNT_0007108133 /DNA_START=258 /DNA_END=1838 /DNA_ORIENTATION=+